MIDPYCAVNFEDKIPVMKENTLKSKTRYGVKSILKPIRPFASYKIARWGVVEWIEHPLLMLDVRSSNPVHSISKYHFFTRNQVALWS